MTFHTHSVDQSDVTTHRSIDHTVDFRHDRIRRHATYRAHDQKISGWPLTRESGRMHGNYDCVARLRHTLPPSPAINCPWHCISLFRIGFNRDVKRGMLMGHSCKHPGNSYTEVKVHVLDKEYESLSGADEFLIHCRKQWQRQERHAMNVTNQYQHRSEDERTVLQFLFHVFIAKNFRNMFTTPVYMSSEMDDESAGDLHIPSFRNAIWTD
jgi:hypothetical protein